MARACIVTKVSSTKKATIYSSIRRMNIIFHRSLIHSLRGSSSTHVDLPRWSRRQSTHINGSSQVMKHLFISDGHSLTVRHWYASRVTRRDAINPCVRNCASQIHPRIRIWLSQGCLPPRWMALTITSRHPSPSTTSTCIIWMRRSARN